MPSIHIDFESRSAVDLRKTGVYVYAESPTTDVWCAAYAIGDGPIELWTPDQPCPSAIIEAYAQGWHFHAWNANFERTMWRHILTPRYGWPEIPLEQWRCTMAAALAMSFPGQLANAAPAVGLDIAKDMQGQGLMLRMARPRKVEDDGSLTWWEDDERKQRLYEYCRQDVEVERQIHKRLTPLTADEQQLYFLDQRINDLGVYVDAALCRAAKEIVGQAAARLNAEMAEATDSAVSACSNVGELAAFCRAQGVEVDSLRKDKLAALLARKDLPDAVRDALELRQDAAKASVKKINSALAGRSADGRAKGLFFFHGATTGRWAGRRIQPQNLQRPAKGANVEQIITDVLTGSLELVEMLHGSALAAIGNAIRGIVCAAPGKRLIAADLANIESRVLAWLAGEEWKLGTFRNYDTFVYDEAGQQIPEPGKPGEFRRSGPDVYVVGYAQSFGIDPKDVTSDQRLIGKVQELALGYQGGVGAFQSMGRLYNVDIGKSYDMLREMQPEFARQATEAYADRGKRSGIPEQTWIASEIVKLGWRAANPRIVELWRDLEESALRALSQPGERIACGRLCFLKSGSFLWVQLPSGRPLCYPFPRLSDKTMPWPDKNGKPAVKPTFTYKTEINRQWVDSYAYGGLWTENVTQATARDILADALKRLDTAGYPIVLHAHDEAVAEVPQGFGSVEEFCQLMSAAPEWAAGCPIAAAGWEGARYRKG